MIKLLVTGYKGFIGKNIYNSLIEFGNCVVDTFSKGDTLPNKDFDIIIHCAGVTPSTVNSNYDYIESNVTLTKQILDKYSNSKIIFFSTKDIYGMPNVDIIYEKTIPYNQSFYGITKFIAEKLIMAESNNYVILRLPAVVGIDSPSTFITKMVSNILQNKEVVIYNGNKKFNSIIHVDDVVSIIKYIIQNGYIINEEYNISSNDYIHIQDIPILISKELNKEVPPVINIATENASSLFSSKKIQNCINLPNVATTIKKYIENIKEKY